MQVKFITESGENKVVLMSQIPRIGDTVHMDNLLMKVTQVVWFPELICTDLKGIDVVITLN